MVECKLVPGEDEFELMTDMMMRHTKPLRRMMAILLILAAACTVLAAYYVYQLILGGSQALQTANVMALVIFVALAAYCIYMVKVGFRKRMMTSLRASNQKMEKRERRYIFGDEIEVHSEKTDKTLAWDAMDFWGEAGRFLYMQFGRHFIIVDKNEIVRGSLEELKQMIKDHGLEEKTDKAKRR